jgi:hypothetical protein
VLPELSLKLHEQFVRDHATVYSQKSKLMLESFAIASATSRTSECGCFKHHARECPLLT